MKKPGLGFPETLKHFRYCFIQKLGLRLLNFSWPESVCSHICWILQEQFLPCLVLPEVVWGGKKWDWGAQKWDWGHKSGIWGSKNGIEAAKMGFRAAKSHLEPQNWDLGPKSDFRCPPEPPVRGFSLWFSSCCLPWVSQAWFS